MQKLKILLFESAPKSIHCAVFTPELKETTCYRALRKSSLDNVIWHNRKIYVTASDSCSRSIFFAG